MKAGSVLQMLCCLMLFLATAAAAASPQHAGMLSSPADLKDKRIGVLLGTTHEAFATRTYPNATVLQYKSPSDLILAVKSGRVDAAIYSYDELAEQMRKDHELGFLGEALFSTPVGAGFHLENHELRSAFNRFLKQIRSDGTYDDMILRWMKNGGTDLPAFARGKTNGTITVGLISDNGLPFTIVRNNRLTGFNVELVERFGIFLGKKIVYADLEFGSLIAAAASRKIDMIAAVMGITEERKQRIAFSDPYYDLGSSAFALKKNIVSADTAGERAAGFRVAAFLKGVAESFQSNIIHEKRYLLILDGLQTTVVVSLFSTLLGTLLGALVCFMRMSSRPLFSLPARSYIALIRGIPVLVILMLIFYVVFASVHISPVLVAIIAFGLNFSAYVAEIFRSGIEGIDRGQTEAGISLGFSRTKTFRYIVLPQMVQRILPVYKGEFISLVKMTSIVGYIAVQDLTKAGDIIRSRTFDPFFPLVMVALLYFLVSWSLMQLLDRIEQKTGPRFGKGP